METRARGDAHARRFQEAWSLHGPRYGAAAAAVFGWLWETGAAGSWERAPLFALFVSIALVAELPLHSPSPGRLRPVWAAVQCAAASAAYASSPGLAAAVLLCASVGGIAAAGPSTWAAGAFFAGAGTVGATYLVLPGPVRLESAAAYAAAVGAAAWIGRQIALRLEEAERHRRTVAELEEARARIARLAETARELAAAEERRKMSEELHDTLGHALVGVLLQAQIAQKLLASDPHEAAAQLASMESSLREALESVRRSLRAGLRGRERLAIDEALRQLAGDFEAAGGPKVEVVVVPGPESVSDLSPEIAEALYRTAQEALTNAVRHGRAQNVRVELESAGSRVFLRVVDDGAGAEEYSPGMGLSGMVSRAQALGGTLRFETAPGKGFRVEMGVKRR